MPEQLPHNPKNAVTASIERVTYRGASAVRKTLSGVNRSTTPKEWRASRKASHLNYWQREHHVYHSDLHDQLQGSGVCLPTTLNTVNSNDQIELTLEDIQGNTGKSLTQDDYQHIVFCWGKAQAQLVEWH